MNVVGELAEQMLPKSFEAIPRWIVAQHISVALQGTENEPPQFISITSSGPILRAVIETAMESFKSISEDDAARAELFARLDMGGDVPMDEMVAEAEMNVSDLLLEIMQYFVE